MRVQAICAFSLGLLVLSVSASAAEIHPIWGLLRTPTSLPFTDTALPDLGQRYDAMQDRVCTRVENRFSGDAVMLARIDDRLMKRFGFTCTVFNAVKLSDDSELTVTLDLFGALGDTVPRGASSVPVLRVNLTASCQSGITVDTLTIRDTGIGLLSDIFAVWLSIDGVRATRAHTLLRDKTASLTFRRPLHIDACSTQTVDVLAAFAGTSLTNGRHSFMIESARGVSSDAPVRGNFPVAGNLFEVGPALSGRVNVFYKPITTPATFHGSEEQVIGRFSVTADTTEDQALHSMTFENIGRSQDGDVVAIFLRGSVGRTPFTETVRHTLDNFVTLSFEPPFVLRKGESIDFDVIGDIVSNTGSTVQLQFEELVDLYAVGSRYGYGVSGQLYGSHVGISGSPARVELR